MSAPAPDVTVVGAGIAGMTAALELLEAGFSVEVIEASPGLGGKFGAPAGRHGHHDFAWHIFADWCVNFWHLARRLGLDKEADFTPRPRLTLLRPRHTQSRWPRVASVSYIGSAEHFWSNVNSGVAHWSDLVLYTYGLYALLSDQTVEREEFLNRVEVNGYMRSLPYMSDVAALLHNELMLRIWAIPSYLISVRSYQTHLRVVAPYLGEASSTVVMNRNFEEGFWQPFRAYLARFGSRFTLTTDTRLTGIRLSPDGGRVDDIVVQPAGESGPRVRPVQSLIVAIPFDRLLAVVTHADSAALRDRVPDLLDLAKLRAQQTTALTLHFRRPIEIPGVAGDPVALLDDLETAYVPTSRPQRNGLASAYAISFIETGARAGAEAPTVLSVLASDVDSLALLDDGEACGRILDELGRYLDFADGDIDWEYSQLQRHRGQPLFVNSVGSWAYRPEVRLVDGRDGPVTGQVWRTVCNLYLAGDYCRSQIDFVSVEGAMHTGIWAAHALSRNARTAGGPPRPEVAPPRRSQRFDEDQALAMKARLEPWARLAARRSRLERDRHVPGADGGQSAAAVVRSRPAIAAAPVAPPGSAVHSPPPHGGTSMSDGLSTAPGFATPVRGVETKWLDEFRRDSIAIHLRSGARVPVPYLFWGTQALQIDGLADADAVDDVLQELGGGQGNLRAQHVNERFEPDGGSGQAHVQIWAPHYEGTSMGPIKAVYGLVQVEPRRSCRRAQDRDLPHLWWWWYYGNSPVNHEFKRDVWGIPNELAPVETSYLTDRKEVRVLQHGRTALRLRATAVPDVVRGMPTPRPPRVVFRTVARRATDDGENLVEVLGHGPVYPATQLEVHTGPDTEVDRQLRRVRFRERGAAFHTGYNGIIKIYDDRGSAKAPVMPGDEG